MPFKNIRRAVSNVGRQVNRAANQATRSVANAAQVNWENAGRGEVGRLVSGAVQSAYNLTVAPARLVTARSDEDFRREVARVGGSAYNIGTGGAADYFARTSGVQTVLNQDDIFGRNLAAQARVVSSAGRGNDVSNYDRNLAVQGLVKQGAAAAAVFGGVAAYSAYGASAATAGTGAAASGSGTAAASGGFFSTGLKYAGAASIAGKVLSGQSTPQQAFGEIAGPEYGDLFSGISNLIGGSGGRRPSYVNSNQADNAYVPEGDGPSLLVLAGLGVAAYFIARRFL